MLAQWKYSPECLQKGSIVSSFESLLYADNIPNYRWRNQDPGKQNKSCFSRGCNSLNFLKQTCCLGMATGSRDPGKPAVCCRVKIRPSFPPWAPSITPTALQGTAGGGGGGGQPSSPGPGPQPSVLFHKPT